MSETQISPLIWEGDRAPLAKALVAAQRATEGVKKAASNPAFKSKYADLAHVVEALVPALNDAGVMVMQSPAFDGDTLALTTTFLHESGASVSSTLNLRPSKLDPQGVGSAITYARRYALLAMAGGAPEDDDGNAASGPRQDTGRPVPKQAPQTAPTLAERAARLAATLNSVTTADDARKAYAMASKLRADLDASDPERLAEIEALYADRLAALEERKAA